MVSLYGNIYFSKLDVADILGVSKAVIDIYVANGMLVKSSDEINCIHLNALMELIRKLEIDVPWRCGNVGNVDNVVGLCHDSDLIDILMALEVGKKKRTHTDKRVDDQFDVKETDLSSTLTPKELAFIFSASYDTICRWLRDGEIVSYVVRGREGSRGCKRVVFFEDFRDFIFMRPEKWYRALDGYNEFNIIEREPYKYKLFKKRCKENPDVKRFLDLYLIEHRRITNEREGI